MYPFKDTIKSQFEVSHKASEVEALERQMEDSNKSTDISEWNQEKHQA